MDITYSKNQKIDIVLSLYSDMLYELTQSINLSGVDYNRVKKAARKVLEESLSDMELGAILKLEGSLTGKFPGVQNRIKILLSTEVKERILNYQRQ